jgi:hypothetical protein
MLIAIPKGYEYISFNYPDELDGVIKNIRFKPQKKINGATFNRVYIDERVED